MKVHPYTWLMLFSFSWGAVPMAAPSASSGASGGWLDLAQETLANPLPLLGPWDFFWGFQWSQGGPERPWPLVEERVEIAGSWADFIDPLTGKQRREGGLATYRLHMTGLRPRLGGYRVRLTEPGSALWIYQEGHDQTLRRAQQLEGELILHFFPRDQLSSWVLILERRLEKTMEPELWSVPRLESGL